MTIGNYSAICQLGSLRGSFVSSTYFTPAEVQHAGRVSAIFLYGLRLEHWGIQSDALAILTVVIFLLFVRLTVGICGKHRPHSDGKVFTTSSQVPPILGEFHGPYCIPIFSDLSGP